MAASTEQQVRSLTKAYRSSQAKNGAKLAALAALYYRQRVAVQDPKSIERWLDLIIPLIMREHDKTARLAASYGDALRRLEVPDISDGFKFTPSQGAVREQVERSLRVVGPEAHLRKRAEIQAIPTRLADATTKQALIADAGKTAETRIGGAVTRHVQNGGRQTLLDGIKEDPVALGYIRVTKSDPCYFCIALASRGIVYGEDSFDESDARFTGKGNVKVHDSCACTAKPVYSTDDAMLVDVANFEALWFEHGASTLAGFRQNLRAAGIKA